MVLGTHRRGGAAVLLDRLTVRSAFLAVERRRVNALFCNPSVWTQFLRDRRSRERDLSSLETVLYGAASMPASAVLELQDSFPDARLFNCYGQTETCGAISFLGPDRIAAGKSDRRAWSPRLSTDRPSDRPEASKSIHATE